MMIQRLCPSTSWTIGWVLALVCGLAAPLDAEEKADQPRVAALEQENAELRRKVAELESRLAELEAENARLTVLAGEAPPEDLEQAQQLRIREIYEESTGATTVASAQSGLRVTDGSRANHAIKLFVTREGRELTADAAGAGGEVNVLVRSWFSGGDYRHVKTLRFIIDGQPVDCPVSDYKADIRTVGGSKRTIRADDEFVTAAMPLDVVKRIADAKHVEGKLGRMKFTLTREQIALFRAVHARVSGAAAP